MLSAIIGGIGNGKTLLTVYLGLLHYLSGYQIISNFNLEYPYKQIHKLEDVEKILKKSATNNTCMLFDEGWITMDSRLSMSKKNVIWTRFMMQTRKIFYDVYLTAQHIGQFDTRVRNTCDRFYFPNITKWEGEPRNSKPLQMKVICIKRNVFGDLVPYNRMTINISDDLLNLYNTRESIFSMEG